jgi:hypothetical protein
MKTPILYTVIIGKRACIVKYAQSPAYETKLFSGSFTDPGEASQELKKSIQGNHEYLKEGIFERKVEQLSCVYQQDLARLAAWNQGKQIPQEVSHDDSWLHLL